jgi:hypothetical protein
VRSSRKCLSPRRHTYGVRPGAATRSQTRRRVRHVHTSKRPGSAWQLVSSLCSRLESTRTVADTVSSAVACMDLAAPIPAYPRHARDSQRQPPLRAKSAHARCGGRPLKNVLTATTSVRMPTHSSPPMFASKFTWRQSVLSWVTTWRSAFTSRTTSDTWRVSSARSGDQLRA